MRGLNAPRGATRYHAPVGETLGASEIDDGSQGLSAPVPGLLLVFGAGRPAAVCVPLVDGSLELGRDHAAFADHPDPRISRRHVRVRRVREQWTVTDLGSRNGALVDDGRLEPNATVRLSRVLRIGDSLLLCREDLAPFRRLGVRTVDGRVEGPTLQRTLQQVRHTAEFGSTLHITGESGAGKEGLARAFHAAGPHLKGPLQAVNCATIPEGLAERLLFGARRGAFSGADADTDGYLQSSHGGTLFLDEIAELPLTVQAKLLRVLETGEVLQLGATKPRRVDLRFCSATHVNLRAQVVAGKFREDLYYRISAPTVAVPPLRDRLEEIPWLIQREVEATSSGLSVHVSFVERCLLRTWPGNLRELLREVRSAVQAALVAESSRVEGRHLAENAGRALHSSPASAPATVASAARPPDPAPPAPTGAEKVPSPLPPTRARLLGVLRQTHGNISASARVLGVHRTQLKRWLERQGIDAAAFAPTGGIKDEPSN